MFILIFRKAFHFLLDIAQTILLAAAFFLVVYVFIARPFQVSGQSMFPNFKDKEYVLTNIVGLRFTSPKLGDVVVFKAPTDNEKDFIKRVIGIPKDRVMVKGGLVYLNGKLLDESHYLDSSVKTYTGSFLKEDQEIIVPDNEYFVMGDNRLYSSDSREWGFVPKNSVIGQSFFVYWPPSQMQVIKNPY